MTHPVPFAATFTVPTATFAVVFTTFAAVLTMQELRTLHNRTEAISFFIVKLYFLNGHINCLIFSDLQHSRLWQLHIIFFDTQN